MKIFVLRRSFFTFRGRKAHELALAGKDTLSRMCSNLGAQVTDGALPAGEKCVLWGEVDLNGQVRPVAAHDLRLAQARRLGFEPVIHPGKGGIATIADLQQKLFHRKQ